MSGWGGAQWFVIFWFLFKALISAAAVSGSINFSNKAPSPFAKWVATRVFDFVALMVLYWGGFFGQ